MSIPFSRADSAVDHQREVMAFNAMRCRHTRGAYDTVYLDPIGDYLAMQNIVARI